ncbi:MAG: glycosyltransferase, partial [Novosphingobium sp.]
MSGATRHFVLAAGGTGGHLIPAFALAVELERRGHHGALVTDSRGAKLPGMTFRPSLAPISRTWPSGWPIRT